MGFTHCYNSKVYLSLLSNPSFSDINARVIVMGRLVMKNSIVIKNIKIAALVFLLLLKNKIIL